MPAAVCRRQSGVGTDTLLEPLWRRPRPRPRPHRQRRLGERGGEVGDEAVDLEPVRQLPVRAPVVAPLPAEPLALHPERGGDEVGTGLVEQPVRLRLAGAEARRRVEAIEHPLAVEEEQPVLRAPLGGEEEQRHLIGRQQLLLIEAERDLPIALCHVPGDIGQPLRAHARSAGQRLRTTHQPLFVGLAGVPDHAASRALPACSAEETARDSPAENAVQNAGRSAAPALCYRTEQELRQQRGRLPLQLGNKRHTPRRRQPELTFPSQSPRRPAEEPTAVSSSKRRFAMPDRTGFNKGT